MRRLIIPLLAAALCSIAEAQGNKAPVTMTITTYEDYHEEQPVLDRHGNPKFDRHGNPKTKPVWVPRPKTRTVEVHLAKVLDARAVSYLQRTDYSYQYNYVSPACLNTWWCHLIVGDPTAQAVAQPVYGEVTIFTFEDADAGDIYIGREAGSYLLSFAINSTVKYIADGNLTVSDNYGRIHQIELVQKILKPTPQQ